MPSDNERIGNLVRKGVLLFAGAVPVPAAPLVAAIAAAAITSALDQREQKVSQVLSKELELPHISYVEPSDRQLIEFFARNPVYPHLADEFAEEIRGGDVAALRACYPFIYRALVLKREVPALLFHEEIDAGRYRELAASYQALSESYSEIRGNAPVEQDIDHFAGELLEVLVDVYEASRDELLNKENRKLFEVIDYIKELAVT